MKLARIQDMEHAADGKFLVGPLLEGDKCNVRIIRMANDPRIGMANRT